MDSLPLRFYAHPLKLVLLFLMMAALCALFTWLLVDPSILRGSAPVAFLSALLFGWGAIAYLAMIALLVVRRRPLLVIDAEGCFYAMPFTFSERFLPWDNIASITVKTRRSILTSLLPSSFSLRRYLVVRAERPEVLPHAQRKSIIHGLLLVWGGPGMAIPFTYFFLWASRDDVGDMFEQIIQAAKAVNQPEDK